MVENANRDEMCHEGKLFWEFPDVQRDRVNVAREEMTILSGSRKGRGYKEKGYERVE